MYVSDRALVHMCNFIAKVNEKKIHEINSDIPLAIWALMAKGNSSFRVAP